MAQLENLTIMFTDIVGFSDMMAKLPRAESQRLLDMHDRVLESVARQFGGNIVKSLGDSLLVTFRSPTDAVLCGMAMQDALWEANQQQQNTHPLVIRVALNTGEVRLTKNDVFGDAVNIAARLESVTPANKVYLTEAVHLSMNKSEASLEYVQAFDFKGVERPVTVYQAGAALSVDQEADTAPKLNGQLYPYGGAHLGNNTPTPFYHKMPIKPLGLSLALLAVVALAGGLYSLVPDQNEPATDTTLALAPKQVTVEQQPPSEKPLEEQESPTITAATKNHHNDNAAAIAALLKEESAPLLASNDYESLQELITEHESTHGKQAYLSLLTGHTDMHFQRHQSALNHYSHAFEADPLLAADPQAVDNMMVLLHQQRQPTIQLMAKHLSDPLIEKLGERSGQEGLRGRYDAFYLLKDSGNVDAVDRVGLNIWDLRELEKCELKKTAVLELKRLKDKRALEALKEVTRVGLLKRFRYSCLRSEAREAIKLIESAQDD